MLYETLKATFHLTISMCATGKIRRNNYHHGSCGSSLTGKMMSVFLIFTQGTHRNVKNRRVRSSLKATFHLTIFDISICPVNPSKFYPG